ncbi:hypothetical protein HZB60_12865 [candidate division KSB1 bacterium]|nr:hypothetical protein [candidate division KSB1 bacterium]
MGSATTQTTASAPVLAYDLPDAELLLESVQAARCLVWQPPHTCVVIGRGSHLEAEVCGDAAAADAVPLYQRPTGGCAVLLTPLMFVASFGLYTTDQLPSAEYFARFARLLIRSLESLGVRELAFRGISDIALRDRKLAGTALYRNRERVFYHAIINAGGSTELMERYLLFPPRTPDYRRNRPHSEFVTSLAEHGYAPSLAQFSAAVEREFTTELTRLPA